MSIKDLFQKGRNKVLSQAQVDGLKKDLESEQLVRNSIKEDRRVLSHVDYSDPSSFSVYGSARKYYEDSIERTYKTYPYDGSLSEKKAWWLESSDLDIWMYENVYPKAAGSIKLGANQYLFVKGGPNKSEGVVEGQREELSKQYPERGGNANIWNTELYRNSNLFCDPSIGNTVEFWAKLDSSVLSQNIDFIPFTVGNQNGIRIQVKWNTQTSELSVIYLDENGNGVSGPEGNIVMTINNLFESSWGHYSFSFRHRKQKVYVTVYKNSELIETAELSVNDMVTNSQLDTYLVLNGETTDVSTQPSGSVDGFFVDEFRFWKSARTEEEINRYWFTCVHGGTNTDNDKYRTDNKKVDLGVYYKFNEGYVGDADYDSIALDYSGRISNATIIGYNDDVRTYLEGSERVTFESAIDESGYFLTKEEKDPIIYSSHPKVASLLEEYRVKGSAHDHLNNSSLYYSIPNWIVEEDSEFGENLLDLTQVLSSYFDSAQVQISRMTELKAADYHSMENTNDIPCPLVRNAIESRGMLVPDLFVEATAFEEILSRGEQYKFEQKINDIKNLIYQNIYNNLPYIYKSKGTEKSFRNLLRCFGIDDEIVKINLYANEQDLLLGESHSATSSKKKFVDFNNQKRDKGVVYSKENPAVAGSKSFIKGMPQNKSASLSFTLETEVIFPASKDITRDPDYYGYTNHIEPIAYVAEYDSVNNQYLDSTTGQILDIRAEKVGANVNSKDVRIVLECAGLTLQTKIFRNVFDNQRFNIAARLVPVDDVLSLVSDGGNCSYELELYCVCSTGSHIEHEDYVKGSVSREDALSILRKDKFISVGAARENRLPEAATAVDLTRMKISSTLFWYDNVTNDEVRLHSLDVLNHGRMYPNENAYVLDSEFAGQIQIPRRDTLALHWDFNDVVTTDAQGTFSVTDVSESLDANRYGWFTDLIGHNISGKGIYFSAEDEQVVNREFIHSSRQKFPEYINPEDLIKIRTFDDEVYKKDPDIVRYFFSIEKSMYQVINDDIINFFASIKEFNDLIGQPVNRYRMQYKSLEKFRNRYFERVKNIPSLEKYVQIFKWIDTSIGAMLYQLIPASSAFSSGLRTMVESHILERNKYWNKLPTIEMSSEPPLGIVRGINELTYNWKDGHAPVSLIPPQVALTAAAFNVTPYIDIGDSPDLEFGDGTTDSAFSISSFVFVPQNYQETSPRRFTLVSKEGEYELVLTIDKHNSPSGDRVGLLFNLLDDSVYDGVTLGPEGRLTVGRHPVFKKGEWHHITVTYDGSSTLDGIQIYVDAVKLTTNIYRLESQVSPYVAMEPTNGSFYIGRPWTTVSFELLEVYFSNVAIFNTELGIEQISELYKNHDSSAYTNAVARWILQNDYQDSIGTLHGTPQGNVNFADNPAYLTNFLWFDKRVRGDDPSVSTGDTEIDKNRESIRRISTRNTEGNTRVVERNGVFIEEDRPLLRDSGGTVYEGQAYVTRALAKPYKLNLDISENIHGGVNYTPTAKDPNSFVRASTRFIPGAGIQGIEIQNEDNPVTYEQWKSLYNVKRSVSISVTDTELSSIQTYDGDLIYPYYGQNYIDPAPVVAGLHNDSYGEDAEIPVQGPFTEAWVGGNQHRHIDFTVQSNRPELYVNDSGTLKHPHEVDPAATLARYTREEVAKRPVNIRNIKTGETRVLGNYSRDYEVVQTSGRSQNNRWFVDLLSDERGDIGITPPPEGYAEFSSGDIITVPDDSSLSFVSQPNDNLDSPFTISAWVKFSSKDGTRGIVSKPSEYKLEWTPSFGLTLYFYGVQQSYSDATFDPDVGTWYHITVTYDGEWNVDKAEAVNFYINSQQIADTTFPGTHDEMTDLTGTLKIGQSFQGQMRSVAIFAKELNQQEISSIASNVDLKNSIAFADLVSWWKLYSGDAQDSVSTNHGVATGVDFEVISPLALSTVINRIPFVSGSNQNNYYPKSYTEEYSIPTRQRSEHVFTERFSAPGDPLTLSPAFMDPLAGEYSVYNSLNFRNLEERTKWQEELYTHSDKYEGSNGYKYSTPQLPIASVHKINRNINVRPTNIQHDNAYISHQIPRSDLQYTFARNASRSYEDLSSKFSQTGNHSLPDTWVTNQSDERAVEFDSSSGIHIPDSSVINFGSDDFTISVFVKIESSTTQFIYQHDGYFLAFFQGKFLSDIIDSSSNTIRIESSAINLQQWYNVVIRYEQASSGDKFRMFVDGVEDYTVTQTSGTYTLPNSQDGTGLHIGSSSTQSQSVVGEMRDFVVAKTALADSKILELSQEKNTSLNSAYADFDAWWRLGGPLDDVSGAESMKDYIGTLNGTPYGTLTFKNATEYFNNTFTGPRIRWDSSNTSDRILSLIGEEKDHYTEVQDPPIDSGMYRWVSPTSTWDTPIRLSYRVYEGRSGGEYGLVDKPEKENDEHLWLQYKIGASGTWITLTEIQSEHPSPISGKRYDIDIYQGQTAENRLYLRWISRGPSGDTGQDAGTLDHDHWGIYDVIVNSLSVSKYYEELPTLKGGELSSATYADYQGAGYRFIRNEESSQVKRQRSSNRFVNVLKTDDSLSRDYIEPAVEWNKPYEHRILTPTSIRLLLSLESQAAVDDFAMELMARESMGYFGSYFFSVIHSYANNLEMFSDPQFNEDIDLRNNNLQFNDTLNELIRRFELLYSGAFFRQIVFPRHSVVGLQKTRSRNKFDSYKVFWKDKFFDRIKCENKTKLGYEVNDEFLRIFKQRYSVDVMDNFYHQALVNGPVFYDKNVTFSTGSIVFDFNIAFFSPRWDDGTHFFQLDGATTSKKYIFSDDPALNGTLNVDDDVYLYIPTGLGQTPSEYFASAINTNQGSDFSASYNGATITIINKSYGLNSVEPIKYSTLIVDMLSRDGITINQFTGGSIEMYKVLGDLSYMGEKRSKHFVTRRDAPLNFIDNENSTVFYNSASSSDPDSVFVNQDCVPSKYDSPISYGDETYRALRSPIPTPQLYYNPNNKDYEESIGWINRKNISEVQKDAYSGTEKLYGAPTYNSYSEFSEELRTATQNYSIIPEYRVSEHIDYHILQTQGNFYAQNYNFLTLDGASYDLENLTNTSGKENQVLANLGTSDYYSPYEPRDDDGLNPFKFETYADVATFNSAPGFRTDNPISSPSQSSFDLSNSVETNYKIGGSPLLVEGFNAAGSFNSASSDDFLKVEFEKMAPHTFQELQLGIKPTTISIWAQHNTEDWTPSEISQKYKSGESFGIWSVADDVESINLFSNYYYSDGYVSKEYNNLGITLAWDSANPAIKDSMPDIAGTVVTDNSTVYTFFKKDGTKAHIEPNRMNNIIVQFVPAEDRPVGDRDGKLNFLIKAWLNGEEIYGVHIMALSTQDYVANNLQQIWYYDSYNTRAVDSVPPDLIVSTGVVVKEHSDVENDNKILSMLGGVSALTDGDYPNSSGTDAGIYRYVEIDKDIDDPHVYLTFKPHEGYTGNPYSLLNSPEPGNEEHLWVQYKVGSGSWENAVQVTGLTSLNSSFVDNRWDGSDEVRVSLSHGQTSANPLRIRFVSLTKNSTSHDHWGIDDVRVLKAKKGLRGFSPCPIGGFDRTIANVGTFDYPWINDYDDLWSATASGLRGIDSVAALYLGNCDHFQNRQVDHTGPKLHRFVGYLDELSIFSENIMSNSGALKMYNLGAPNNPAELNNSSQLNNTFAYSSGDAQRFEYDVGLYYADSFMTTDVGSQPFSFVFNSVTGPSITEENNPILPNTANVSFYSGVKVINFSGTATEDLGSDDEDYPTDAQGVVLRSQDVNDDGDLTDAEDIKRHYRWAQLNRPIYSPITVSFRAFEGGAGSFGAPAFDTLLEPDPLKSEHLWLQYKVGNGKWITALQVEGAVGTTKRQHNYFDNIETVAIGEVGQDALNPMYIRWLTMAELPGTAASPTDSMWAIGDIKVVSTDRVIEVEPLNGSTGQIENQSFGGYSLSRGYSFTKNNYGYGTINSLKKSLIAWHRIGFPKYTLDPASIASLGWDEEFLETYAITDGIINIASSMRDDVRNAQFEKTQKIKLEVNAIKKLLPYDGFYPQDRTVQIADLFVQKIEKDILPSSRFSENGTKQYKEQSIQAALQHFFAPGILYNSIKSGIACDWASYTNKSGFEPSHFGQEIKVLDTNRQEIVKFSRNLVPHWYTSMNLYMDLLMENQDLTPEQKDAAYRDSAVHRASDEFPIVSQDVNGFDLYPFQSTVPLNATTMSVDSLVITGSPTTRLPFEAILNPYNYLFNSSEQSYTPSGTDYTVTRKPYQFFLMAPSYYKEFVRSSNLALSGGLYYEVDNIEGDYENYSFPYFEIKQNIDVDYRYELAINNFLAESVRFFLEGETPTSEGSLKYFRSKREDHFRDFIPGNEYKMDITLSKKDKVTLLRTNHVSQYANDGASEYIQGGRYYGPPTLWYYDPDKIGDFNKDYLHREPAFAPYVPSYFYAPTTATISFTASSTRHTIDEIHSRAVVIDSSPGTDFYFQTQTNTVSRQAAQDTEGISIEPHAQAISWENLPAYKSKMPVSASVEMFGKARLGALSVDSQGIERYEENPGSALNSWVINTRYECPVFDFNTFSNTTEEGEIRTRYGINTTAKEEIVHPALTHYASYFNKFNTKDYKEDSRSGIGVWAGIGQFEPGALEIKLSDPYERKNSLAYVCGFEPATQPIGKTSNSRKIKEAVVMIPFIDDPSFNADWVHTNDGFKVIGIPTYVEQRGKYELRQPIYEKRVLKRAGENANRFEYQTEIIHETSVTNMIDKMKEYIIPPRFDFVKNENIRPFAMYIVDFEHILNSQDLKAIWEGLQPEIAKRAVLDSSTIEHNIGPYEVLDDSVMGLDSDMFGKLKWLVFKAKKKAEKSYYKVMENQQFEHQFRFNISNRIQEPDYGYNYPYDYFTMLEKVQVVAEVKVSPSEGYFTEAQNQLMANQVLGRDDIDDV